MTGQAPDWAAAFWLAIAPSIGLTIYAVGSHLHHQRRVRGGRR